MLFVGIELCFALGAVDFASDGVFDEFVEHQRNGEEDLGFVFLHNGFHVHRHRHLAEYDHVHSQTHRRDQVAGEAEDVAVREYAHIVFSPAVRRQFGEAFDVPAEIAYGEHYALRAAGGAGGVHYGAYVVHAEAVIVHVGNGEALRITLREELVEAGIYLRKIAPGGEYFHAVDVYCRYECRHSVEVHCGEIVLFRI